MGFPFDWWPHPAYRKGPEWEAYKRGWWEGFWGVMVPTMFWAAVVAAMALIAAWILARP
jgi:hypothetical protein